MIDKINMKKSECKNSNSDHELIIATNSDHALLKRIRNMKKFSCDPHCVIYAKDSMHVSNKCVSKAFSKVGDVLKKCKCYSFVNLRAHIAVMTTTVK